MLDAEHVIRIGCIDIISKAHLLRLMIEVRFLIRAHEAGLHHIGAEAVHCSLKAMAPSKLLSELRVENGIESGVIAPFPEGEHDLEPVTPW